MRKNINSVDIGARFRKVLPHKNVITPDVLIYQYAGDYIVELSHGESMSGGDMYGVTVVNAKKREHEREMSKCFDTRKEARTYINKLAQL